MEAADLRRKAMALLPPSDPDANEPDSLVDEYHALALCDQYDFSQVRAKIRWAVDCTFINSWPWFTGRGDCSCLRHGLECTVKFWSSIWLIVTMNS